MNAGPSRFSRAVFFAIVALSALPVWLTRYLPIQDLPQHLAAIRVLSDYDDPALGFSRYFEIDLFRTQYLAYYLAARALSLLFDVELANRLLVTLCIVGTPYALARLLRALGGDPRFALAALPLSYNAHFLLGFVNFLLAIPLALLGLALAVEQRRAPRAARSVELGAVALVCFYAHVVPFAFLGLGVVLVSLELRLRALVLRLLPLLPAGAAALLWALESPAGRATVTAARGADAGPRPSYQPAAVAFAELPSWLTDILHGDDDLQLLHAFYALLAASIVLGVARALVARDAAPDALGRSLRLRLLLLPPLAALLYFVAPTSYDWIWPIAQRFPLLSLLFALACLPPPPRYVGEALLGGFLIVNALQTKLVTQAFHDFEAHEVGDFDRALEVIPQGQRVLGLISARGSRYVKFSPFIHYVAYYQARKGGAVMFTFADFPQSPFRFREANRPPRVPPRWEWMPERVRPEDLDFYDYVLSRGRAPQIERSRGYALAYRGERYRVWKKLR